MKLSGRILAMADDATVLKQQLEGEDYPGTELALHYGVNTDAMISGRACTLGYTPEILGPYFLENFKEVVGLSSVKDGGFQVIVGGDAYGTGSSREAAVVAHQGAGIELVIAKSFQRIFQENMVYAGLPFTTDFGVIERLQSGEDIPIEEFHHALPPFFREVALRGGLLDYGKAWLAGELTPWYDVNLEGARLSVVEKIIARKAWRGGAGFGIASVSAGDQVLCAVAFRGMHEYTAGMCMALYKEAFGMAPVTQPEQVAVFEDHFVLIDEDTVPQNVKEFWATQRDLGAADMFAYCEATRNGTATPLQQRICGSVWRGRCSLQRK